MLDEKCELELFSWHLTEKIKSFSFSSKMIN